MKLETPHASEVDAVGEGVWVGRLIVTPVPVVPYVTVVSELNVNWELSCGIIWVTAGANCVGQQTYIKCSFITTIV